MLIRIFSNIFESIVCENCFFRRQIIYNKNKQYNSFIYAFIMTNIHLTIHLRHSTKTHHIFNNATVRSNKRISEVQIINLYQSTKHKQY